LLLTRKLLNQWFLLVKLTWSLRNILDWLTVMQYIFKNDNGYVTLVVNTPRSFPHSWLIIGFVTRLTRRVSLLEQELLTLPEHLSSPPVFSGVHVTRSLVLCVCFVDRCLSFCPFFLWPLCCLSFIDLRLTKVKYEIWSFSYWSGRK
jgi:hypothetical protein